MAAANRSAARPPEPPPPDASALDVPGVSQEELAPALGLYQLVDPSGKLVLPERELPKLDEKQLLEMYRGIVMIRTMDERLLALQRQGRIGFYGEARGQEAA